MYLVANNFESWRSLTEQSTIHPHTTSLIPKEVFVQQAVDIAQELQKRAIRATDGSTTWMGMDYLPDVGRFQHVPMSYDLYDEAFKQELTSCFGVHDSSANRCS